MLHAPLAEIDPEVQNIVDKETWRQLSGLELIASEVSLHLTDLSSLNIAFCAELDQSSCYGGQWLHLNEQIL